MAWIGPWRKNADKTINSIIPRFMVAPSLLRLGCRRYHASTEFCTTTAFCGARSAQRMVGGVLFADLGTCITDVGTEAAQPIGHRGTSTHPLAGQHTDIRALAAQPNTIVPFVSDHHDGPCRSCRRCRSRKSGHKRSRRQYIPDNAASGSGDRETYVPPFLMLHSDACGQWSIFLGRFDYLCCIWHP